MAPIHKLSYTGVQFTQANYSRIIVELL